MYNNGTYITKPVGNNEFSYNERIALGSEAKIFVPNLIQGTVNDLEEGSEIVFEEVEPTKSRFSRVKNGKLMSCTGLKHFIQTDYHGIPTYIVDNHNHALTFRQKYRLNVSSFERLVVLHIDQHADTKPNNNKLPITGATANILPITEIEDFVNTQTNVGNFISAALNNGIINEVIQIRSEHALHHFDISTIQQGNIIVDIDVDFWEGKDNTEREIQIIKNLMKQAKLITIATSPYFFDQKKAIKLIKKLLQ